MVSGRRSILYRSRNPDFDPGRVGKIDDMALHAEVFSPLWLATGTGLKVTAFRAYHAQIALGQSLKTGITIPLAVTLAACTATMLAFNAPVVNELDSPSDTGIKVKLLLIER